jgi:hypothetical protein
MKSSLALPLCALLALSLPGCVARTALNVATAPVKATAKVADWATVSGDEADRARGRELRKKCKERPDDYYCRKD